MKRFGTYIYNKLARTAMRSLPSTSTQRACITRQLIITLKCRRQANTAEPANTYMPVNTAKPVNAAMLVNTAMPGNTSMVIFQTSCETEMNI